MTDQELLNIFFHSSTLVVDQTTHITKKEQTEIVYGFSSGANSVGNIRVPSGTEYRLMENKEHGYFFGLFARNMDENVFMAMKIP